MSLKGKKMKILVTGSAGFIGFHVVQRLLKKNIQVTSLDNINDYYDVSLKYGRLEELGINKSNISYGSLIQSEEYKNHQFIQCDLSDKEAIDDLFTNNKFDVVCHLAAQAGVRYSIENPYAYIESNIQGFMNILEACRHTSVQHLVYASSSSVYGANTCLLYTSPSPRD